MVVTNYIVPALAYLFWLALHGFCLAMFYIHFLRDLYGSLNIPKAGVVFIANLVGVEAQLLEARFGSGVVPHWIGLYF